MASSEYTTELKKLLLHAMSQLDCQDSSCWFKGYGPGGMRTNGGCRCFKDMPSELRRMAREIWQNREDQYEQLKRTEPNKR